MAVGPRGWGEAALAQGYLVAAQLSVWTSSRGSLLKPPVPGNYTEHDLTVARRWATAVSRAASYGVFRPRCLARALALQRILHRRGISAAQLRLGVRLADGKFTAHAWVSLGDEPIGESRESLRPYHPMPTAPSG